MPPAERIAVFDNDGTLWTEQPVYFQALFVRDRIAWLLKGDLKALMAGGEKALRHARMVTHTGMTSDEFSAVVSDWITTARHPKTGLLLTDMTFQPRK